MIYNMCDKLVRENAFYQKANFVFVIDGLAMIVLSIATLICYEKEGQNPFRPLFIYITCALILHSLGCLICTKFIDRYIEPGFKIWNAVYCIVFRIISLCFYIADIAQPDNQPIGRYFSFALLVDPFMNFNGKTGSSRSTVTCLYNQLFFAIYMIMYIWQDRSDVGYGVLDVFSRPLMILVLTGVAVNALMVIAVALTPCYLYCAKKEKFTCRGSLPILIMTIDIILAIGFCVCLAKFSETLKTILDNNVGDAEQINIMLAWRAASRRWLMMIVIYLPFRLISLLFITMAVKCDMTELDEYSKWPYFIADLGQFFQVALFTERIERTLNFSG